VAVLRINERRSIPVVLLSSIVLGFEWNLLFNTV
jgi:hypothetical protein